MIYTRIFNCFHGTTEEHFKSIEENIAKGEKNIFKFSPRKDHWLGNGVYFFLDDESKAKWWASMAVRKYKEHTKEKISAKTFYIEAKASSDKVIDLNTELGQKIFFDFLDYIKKAGIKIEVPVNKSMSVKQQQLESRCKLMDLLAHSEEYVASCYQFSNSEKPYVFKDLEHYGILNNKGNQLCVYNQEILDFSTMQLIE